MEESTANRFDYLRALTRDEQLNEIADLEEDIAFLESIINNPRASGEQVSESRNDLDYDHAKLRYLKQIIEEPQL